MILALITGTLYRAPEQRTSAAGKAFVSATIKETIGDDIRWVKIVAFSETVRGELMRLADGDAVSVQGPLKASIYLATDGANKISLSLVVNHLLALRQPPKKRKENAPAPAPFNDDIGFGGEL